MQTEWITWDNSQLIGKNILEIGDGYRAKNSEMGALGLPFARAGNIDNGFHFDNADILDESSVKKAGNKISQSYDIVFTSKGTVGRFAFVRPETPKFVYSPQLCYWRVKNPSILDPRYLFYWMHSSDFKQQVHQVKSLTTMADYVSLSDQRKMHITTPFPPIQRVIASILSAYDDLIENNTRRIVILEEMAQMLYEEWFVKFRFPGYEQAKMVESELGMIPEGWEVRKLGDALTLQRGFDLPAKQRQIGNVPIYAATGINGTHDEAKVKGPGVLTGRSGSIGTVMYVKEDFWPLNTALWVKNFNLVSPIHAFYLLNSLPLTSLNSGAAVPTLNRNDVHKLPIVLPQQELASRFDEYVLPMFDLKWYLTKRNSLLRRTRDLLLPKLISGKSMSRHG